LKSLCNRLKYNEIEALKVIFNSCQQLETIGVWCGEHYLNEVELLEVVVKYSPKNFYELKINYIGHTELSPDELEPIFTGWANCRPQKSLSEEIISV